MRCFCGCGRRAPRFPLGLGSINTRGRRIGKDVALIEMLLATGLQSPNAEAFVEDGHAILSELAEAVHTRTDPGRDVETESREFMRRTRERFLSARIGQAAGRAGLKGDEAAHAMARGEWDPFAD